MLNNAAEKLTVDYRLNHIDYSINPNYIPNDFALEFVTILRQYNGTIPHNLSFIRRPSSKIRQRAFVGV